MSQEKYSIALEHIQALRTNLNEWIPDEEARLRTALTLLCDHAEAHVRGGRGEEARAVLRALMEIHHELGPWFLTAGLKED